MDKLKDLWQKNWKQYAVWLLICGALYVLYLTGHIPGFNPPSPPVPIFEIDKYQVADGQYDFGWQKDEAAVKAVVATLPFKAFADTPAGAVADVPDHFYQWDVYRKANPRGPPIRNQGSVGSCVGNGGASAIVRTLACQIVLDGANEELKDLSVEVLYAGSRIEIGGGRIRGDGSVGAWLAKFANQYGIAPAEKITTAAGKTYDLSSYDQARCRAWGNSGVPDDLEPLCKKHPVQEITLIKTLDELKRALAQGYGVSVCSGQGFSMQRDSRGVARPSGSWAHCMCIDGYHTEVGKEFYHIENSWGPDAHKGPVGWGNPSTAGFWAEAAVVQQMLAAGDTWAFSGVKGFPARESIWFVQRKQRDADVRLASFSPRRSSFPCSLHFCSP